MAILSITDQIHGLIGSIYEHAVDGDAPDGVLHDLCGGFESAAASIGTYDFSQMRGTIQSSVNIADQFLTSYDCELSCCNPWMISRRAYVQGAVSLGEEQCPTERLLKTDFYNRFMLPQGLLYRLCGVISHDGPVVHVLSFLRSAHASPFDGNDKRRLANVLPHLERAMEIHDRLIRDRSERHDLFAVLDHLPVACLVVNRGGHLRFGNRTAIELLARRDGLMTVGGCLTAAAPKNTSQLRRLFNEVAGTNMENGTPLSGEHVILARGAGRSPLIGIVFPIHPTTIDDAAPRDRAVAILIKDPDNDTTGSSDDFATVYGLTPAEARLIALLSGGLELREAAVRLGITKNTVRTHMRNIYSKVGAHRQADIVRLLARFSMF